jgi:hypothetical protein
MGSILGGWSSGDVGARAFGWRLGLTALTNAPAESCWIAHPSILLQILEKALESNDHPCARLT